MKTIAFWGYPNPEVINKYKNLYKDAKWIDVDIDFNAPDTRILPESYCKIIKNMINNCFYFKPDIILAAIGKEKCDSGWYASLILKKSGFNVITSIYEQTNKKEEIKISTSSLPLKKKVEMITSSIIEPSEGVFKYIKPTFGFWGVPPNDLSILELFPDSTHLFGWIRAVEAKVPADLELETYVEKDLPTVFYAQAFCAKTQLAKYLADKYNGLYIDIDDNATNSVKAKIEAFLRLG